MTRAVFITFLLSLGPWLWGSTASAKKIALSFDDAPVPDSYFFDSLTRTKTMIQELKALGVPEVGIFANACIAKDRNLALKQIKLYADAGHAIGNHTCTHPRLDDVGFDFFVKDSLINENYLRPFMRGQKYFRFPYLAEGTDPVLYEKMKAWLKSHNYLNAAVSIDTGDTTISTYMNTAKGRNQKFDMAAAEKFYVDHVANAADFYESQSQKYLGYSPKHVVLLHEIDTSVLFLPALVKELRQRGWEFIPVSEAYKDPLYHSDLKNTFFSFGRISQTIYEKTRDDKPLYYHHWQPFLEEVKKLFGFPPN